ncbi:hypothetical protein VT94_05070 [Clostridium sporogenes]|nr:hypothetical protein VT94_05070 [Clostridium sporogenes]OQP89735.1 hypothetical protein VT93_0201420 [Clostridium sporogenes]
MNKKEKIALGIMFTTFQEYFTIKKVGIKKERL